MINTPFLESQCVNQVRSARNTEWSLMCKRHLAGAAFFPGAQLTPSSVDHAHCPKKGYLFSYLQSRVEKRLTVCSSHCTWTRNLVFSFKTLGGSYWIKSRCPWHPVSQMRIVKLTKATLARTTHSTCFSAKSVTSASALLSWVAWNVSPDPTWRRRLHTQKKNVASTFQSFGSKFLGVSISLILKFQDPVFPEFRVFKVLRHYISMCWDFKHQINK